MSKVAFTIVAKNYFASALALRNSLQKSDPSVSFFIFLCDQTSPEFCEQSDGEEFILVDEKIVPQFRNMAFKYDVVELCTAVKPFIFKWLLGHKNGGTFFYIDPDCMVYSRLDSLVEILKEKAVVLTPHICFPANETLAAMPEDHFLISGAFNLGFIALRKGEISESFLDWWCERLKDRCYVDKHRGLFYDQKWLDLAPCLLGDSLIVLRDPGYNLAPWNLHERSVFRADGEFRVSFKSTEEVSSPLVFCHFSGFDPTLPGKISKRDAGNPNYDAAAHGEALSSLYCEYSSKLLELKYSDFARHNYSYGSFSNGTRITKLHRRLYRVVDESVSFYRLEDEYQKFVKSKFVEISATLGDPFQTQEGSFFRLLLKKNLVDYRISMEPEKEILTQYTKYTKLIRFMVFGYQIVARVLGLRRFTMLLRFLERYSRPESLGGILIDG